MHERFREGVAPCFVISPIGEKGSDTRKRADEVFETYVKPACDPLYRPVRGEMMTVGLITQEIEAALQTSPMVIAYLGNPKVGWNANVMYELGYRRASGLPVILLKDETVDGKRCELPFDLKDLRAIDLPEATPTDEGVTIRTIRDHMRKQAQIAKPGLATIYPSGTVEMVICGRDDQNRYTEASPELEALFELPDIKAKTLDEVIEHLAKKMQPDQADAFRTEQVTLIGKLTRPIANPDQVSATVPILFEHHSKLRGHAFLPIIVSHLFIRPTATLRLHVVYIEVTSATHRKGNYYECTLTGGALGSEAG